ncbi:hypothetical protein R6Q57_002731 [Mikania cordata]
MYQRQNPSFINPNSLKIRLAYRFLHNLNNLNAKRSHFSNTQIHHRSRRVKIATYASMASVVGRRRSWSRAILSQIRNKKRVDLKTSHRRHHHRHHLLAGIKRRRSVNDTNPKRIYVDPFSNSGQELKLRKLVPGAETMDACGLLDETADYIKCLATQVPFTTYSFE